MESMVTSKGTMLEYVRGKAHKFQKGKSALSGPVEDRFGDLLLPLQQHTSRTSRNSASGGSIGFSHLRVEDNGRAKMRRVLRRLLTTGILLIHLSCCTPRLQSFVYAADPNGDTRIVGRNEQTATHEKTNMYYLSTHKELETIPANAEVRIDFDKTEIYHQRTAAQLAGLRFLSDTKGNRFSALSTKANTSNEKQNPWEGLLTVYDVPLVHGAGVKVDLGNEKTYKKKKYREPGGQCPVYGKYIELHQPTGKPDIWPNDYLAQVPFAGTPQDTIPLGGGFGLPIPDISPHTLEQLKERVKQADSLKDPDPYMMKYRKQIQDDLGYCVWWTRISPAEDKTNKNPDLDLRYRYSVVWDNETQLCTLLYVNMQELTGAGTYCTWGNKKPLLTWYCFLPKKDVKMKNRVWTSPYTRFDHAKMCPKNGLKHVHWGQWNGQECQKIAPRKRLAVENAAECAVRLFDNSPSDNPTKYTGDEGRGLDQILHDLPGVLFPAGALGRDQPHSRGVGVNWANYYPKLTGSTAREHDECEMYDGVPDCLTHAPAGFAFVSLASPDPDDASLPPCAPQVNGTFVGEPCRCPPNTQRGWICLDGTWKETKRRCTCGTSGKMNAWAVAAPILGIATLLGIATAYLITRRQAILG